MLKKKELALQNGIEYYIELNCNESDKEYMVLTDDDYDPDDDVPIPIVGDNSMIYIEFDEGYLSPLRFTASNEVKEIEDKTYIKKKNIQLGFQGCRKE